MKDRIVGSAGSEQRADDINERKTKHARDVLHWRVAQSSSSTPRLPARHANTTNKGIPIVLICIDSNWKNGFSLRSVSFSREQLTRVHRLLNLSFSVYFMYDTLNKKYRRFLYINHSSILLLLLLLRKEDSQPAVPFVD